MRKFNNMDTMSLGKTYGRRYDCYMCVCVCACGRAREMEREREREPDSWMRTFCTQIKLVELKLSDIA